MTEMVAKLPSELRLPVQLRCQDELSFAAIGKLVAGLPAPLLPTGLEGRLLALYGTLDEYLTGEHDKMVNYVYRFVSENEMVLEVHGLPIGLSNTKVIEIKFEPKSQAAYRPGP